MGKKSKRPNRGNRKPKTESAPAPAPAQHDSRKHVDVTKLSRYELMPIARNEPCKEKALAYYGHLIALLFMEENASKQEMSFYVDEIFRLCDFEYDTLPREVAYPLFFAILRIQLTQLGVEIYRIHLKGSLPLAHVLNALSELGHDPTTYKTHVMIQILEDHKHVAAKSTNMKELHAFYENLSTAYRSGHRFVDERESLKKQLNAAKELKDHYLQFNCMKEMADNSRKTGKYEESMDMLKECMELSSVCEGQLESEGKISSHKWAKADLFSKMGMVIKTRSVAEHGVIMHCDAVAALDAFKKASELAASVADDFDKIHRLAAFLRHLGRSYGDVGDHEKGIEEVLRSGELSKPNPRDKEKLRAVARKQYAFEEAAMISLQQFYRLKSRGEPFQESEILHMAKDYIQQALDYDSIIIDTVKAPSYHPQGLFLEFAQAHYFCHETSEAYKYLALFLDDHIIKGGFSCGACEYRSSKQSVRKICGGCNSTYYCSSTCQSLHWKTNISGMIRHKDLCPLINFWQKSWKEYLEKSKDFSSGKLTVTPRDETELKEFISEHCEEIFKGFFEGLLEKEHGPVGHCDVTD